MAKKTVKERIEEAGGTVSTEPETPEMKAALDKIEQRSGFIHPVWEHDFVEVKREHGVSNLIVTLTEFGDEGYELVHVSDTPYVWELFFKRMKV